MRIDEYVADNLAAFAAKGDREALQTFIRAAGYKPRPVKCIHRLHGQAFVAGAKAVAKEHDLLRGYVRLAAAVEALLHPGIA